jgi:hypothetical protein
MASGDLPSGSQKVCPRCGTDAGDSVWCSSCGLNLKRMDELPTADAYAARARERRWMEERKRNAQPTAPACAEDAKGRKRAERSTAAPDEGRAPVGVRGRPGRLASFLVALGVLIALFAALSVTDFDAPGVGLSPLAADDDESGEDPPAEAAEVVIDDPAPSEADSEEGFVVDNLMEPLSEPTTLLIGNHLRFVNITWSGWGSDTATGEGTIKTIDCVPSCAAGTPIREPATITLGDVEDCGGERRYTGLRARSESTEPFDGELGCEGPAGGG